MYGSAFGAIHLAVEKEDNMAIIFRSQKTREDDATINSQFRFSDVKTDPQLTVATAKSRIKNRH